MGNKKGKIFVSYTEKDEKWASWIAEELEKHEIEVIFKAWDFKPGDNFVEKMDEALRTSSKVVAVLSKAYLKSYHCQAELTAAYVKKNKSLIPVRVENFKVKGLWAPINYIDLVKKSEEEASKLLERILKEPERKSQGYPGVKVSGDFKPPNDLTEAKRSSSGVTAPTDRMPPNNLTVKNFKFTGREELLNEIYDSFHKNSEVLLVQSQAITGMGGIGKTETAKEYAYRFRQEYRYIWWVNAETSITIEADYRAFAEKNRLCSFEDKPETILAHVKTWMQKNSRWLFIFDNAENEKSIEKYFTASGYGGRHILVTSRNSQFENFIPVNINVFTELEACELIEKYTLKPADGHFKVLAKRMGYLPLAIDQAGAYMYKHKKSYKTYLDLYNKYNLTLLKENDDDPEKKTVATTWQISFDKIKNKAAKQLLNLCAFFAPDKILTQWFQRACDVLPAELRELREVATNEMKYDKAIGELTQHYLVNQNEEGVLNIHRLVQEVIRDRLKKEQSEWRNLCVDILNKLSYFDFSTAESRALFLNLTTHIDFVTEGISDEEASEEVAQLYHFMGFGFKELADYPQSLKYSYKALVIRERVLGTEHPDTVVSYNNIGGVYSAQGNYVLALEFYGKALAIHEKVLDTEHPDTSLSYNNIGAVYCALGNYVLALEFYGKALAIREKVLGIEHPDTAISYNNIGFIHDSLGNYNLALEYHGKAIAIREKVLGIEHPDTAFSYNNIGAVYDLLGNYDLALEFYGKALAIREKVLGIEHPDTAISYNNIGFIHDSLGNYNLALENYKKTLAILEKVLGTEHPNTAVSYNNIGLVYREQGNYCRALEYHGKALSVREKVLGKEHPDTAFSYNNIGFVQSEQGNYDIALENYEKTLAILQKVLGMEHPTTATSYNNIGFVYSNLGNYDLALEYYEKALAIREKVLGTEHPDTAFSYNNIGFVYSEQGNYDLALEYIGKALSIREKVFGKEHPYTALSYNNIGLVYSELSNYDLALEYIGKALSIREKVLGKEHPDTKISYDNLAFTYEKSGNPEPFEEWIAKKMPKLES